MSFGYQRLEEEEKKRVRYRSPSRSSTPTEQISWDSDESGDEERSPSGRAGKAKAGTDQGKKEKRRGPYWLACLAYFLGQMLGFGLLMWYPSTFRKSLEGETDSRWAHAFIGLTLMCDVLYMHLRYANPGWVTLQSLAEQVEFSQPPDGYYTDLASSSSDDSDDIESGLTRIERRLTLSERLESHNRKPLQGYCQECRLKQPLRTRHCKFCNMCVARYDHHCFWIDRCVGSYNHTRFQIFVYLALVALSWGLFMVVDCWTWEWGKTVDQNLVTNGGIIFGFLCAFPCWGMLIALASAHTWFALTNQTTWEMMKGKKIYYLADIPEGVKFPFGGSGIRANLRYSCCGRRRLRYYLPRWEDEDNPELARFNWLDNEYYSCC